VTLLPITGRARSYFGSGGIVGDSGNVFGRNCFCRSLAVPHVGVWWDRGAGVRGTAVEHPNALAVAMVGLDLDGRAELATLRELQPVLLHRVRIGRRIGIGGLGKAAVAQDGPRANGDANHQCHSHNVFQGAPPLVKFARSPGGTSALAAPYKANTSERELVDRL
jgi:hypothetical protein